MTRKREGEDPAYDAARIRLGAAIRRLSHAAVRHEADMNTMDDTTDTIDSLIAHLGAHPARSRSRDDFGFHEEHLVPDQSPMYSHIDRPGSGPGSPHGLDMTIHPRGDRVEATFELGHSHEGAPGRSHGGFVALAFDDLMGFVLVLERVAAYTVELTVRYKAPTPLLTPLVMTCWLTKRDGRKLFIEGELRENRPDAPLIASAAALFIAPNI